MVLQSWQRRVQQVRMDGQVDVQPIEKVSARLRSLPTSTHVLYSSMQQHALAHPSSESQGLPAGIMPSGSGVPTGTPLTDPPLIEAISEDPVLRQTKLIAEAWDCDGLNQVGAFPHYGGRWAEWNGQFRDSVRAFLKVGLVH